VSSAFSSWPLTTPGSEPPAGLLVGSIDTRLATAGKFLLDSTSCLAFLGLRFGLRQERRAGSRFSGTPKRFRIFVVVLGDLRLRHLRLLFDDLLLDLRGQQVELHAQEQSEIVCPDLHKGSFRIRRSSGNSWLCIFSNCFLTSLSVTFTPSELPSPSTHSEETRKPETSCDSDWYCCWHLRLQLRLGRRLLSFCRFRRARRQVRDAGCVVGRNGTAVCCTRRARACRDVHPVPEGVFVIDFPSTVTTALPGMPPHAERPTRANKRRLAPV